MARTQTTYHASFTQYEVGKIVKAEKRLPIGLHARVEGVLTQLQPHDVISRANGLCVAHSAAHAMMYLQAETNTQGLPIHVYEVMVPRLVGLPMALIDCIAESIGNSIAYDMAAEYWNPTENWKFLESVVDQMEIVSLCGDINTMALRCAHLDYQFDKNRANVRWKLQAST